MYLTVSIAVTAAIAVLAIVLLIRGLRAKSRLACDKCAGGCLTLAALAAVAAVVAKVVALASSFAGVANADPAARAMLLSEQIERAMTAESVAIPAALAAVVFAVVLLIRSRRLPAATER
jgi:hypothetical protein